MSRAEGPVTFDPDDEKTYEYVPVFSLRTYGGERKDTTFEHCNIGTYYSLASLV